MSQVAWLFCLLNIIFGLILFFAMSGITSWGIFATPEAKIFPFILGMLLLGNGVFLAFSNGLGPFRRR